jgi:MFS family permease
VNTAVGDLYFVHERGKRMALTNLAVFGGAFFTPILVGKITHTIGWQWSFYFVAIFCACCFPAVFFFCPETAYRRSASLNTDMASTENLTGHRSEDDASKNYGHKTTGSDNIALAQPSPVEKDGFAATHPEAGTTPYSTNPQKVSYKESLRLFNGRKTDESFWKLLIRPFPLFAHPAILWAALIQGCMIGWTVFIGIILAAIFLGPPLFWDEERTGYAYTGAFIGAILGFLVAGGLADWSAKYMTRRNNGVYEPEFRIILVIPQLIFGCAGLYGFGYTSANMTNYHWIWPIFFFALEVMGMVIGAVASALYIVDAHREIAVEAFTCLIIFKNFFSFGLTFSAYDWVKVTGGVYRSFMGISSVQLVVCLLSIPMCKGTRMVSSGICANRT